PSSTMPSSLSLHDALPILAASSASGAGSSVGRGRLGLSSMAFRVQATSMPPGVRRFDGPPAAVRRKLLPDKNIAVCAGLGEAVLREEGHDVVHHPVPLRVVEDLVVHLRIPAHLHR